MITLCGHKANAVRGKRRVHSAVGEIHKLIQAAVSVYCIACALSLARAAPTATTPEASRAPSDLAVVDCVLPNQGQKARARTSPKFSTRIVSATLKDCCAKDGDYTSNPDRAGALRLWLPVAESGDSLAQNRVGEIFESGMGAAPDYATAAEWYRKAAEQGESRAQVNLAALYEKGLGVPKNPLLAQAWYRRAAGHYGNPVSGSTEALRDATSELRRQEAQLARMKAELEDLRERSELDTGE